MPAAPAPTPTVPSPLIPASATPAFMQCLIPSANANQLLTYSAGTDVLVEVINNNGGYNVRLSYQQNGKRTNVVPSLIYGVSVVKGSLYPTYTVFAAPSSQIGGFSITYDTSSARAQFNPYPGSGARTSGLVSCSLN